MTGPSDRSMDQSASRYQASFAPRWREDWIGRAFQVFHRIYFWSKVPSRPVVELGCEEVKVGGDLKTSRMVHDGESVVENRRTEFDEEGKRDLLFEFGAYITKVPPSNSLPREVRRQGRYQDSSVAPSIPECQGPSSLISAGTTCSHARFGPGSFWKTQRPP